MPHFVMATRLASEALSQPRSFETLERHVAEQVRRACPDVEWIANYAITGPYDYIDVFSAPDLETALRVSVLVRSYGRSHSEVWPAFAWDEFRRIVHGLAPG